MSPTAGHQYSTRTERSNELAGSRADVPHGSARADSDAEELARIARDHLRRGGARDRVVRTVLAALPVSLCRTIDSDATDPTYH
jgi:hypothetical protein